MQASKLRADVRVTDTLDGLEVLPRPGSDVHDLRKGLRECLGSKLVQRQGGGIWDSGRSSPALLSLNTTDRIELSWTEEARLFSANRKKAWDHFDRCYSEVQQIKGGGPSHAKRLLRGVQGLEVLDDHQWVNVAAMTVPDSPGLCVFDEQGAGKTVTLIFAFDLLVARNEIDCAIIIAPKSMVAEWPNDFARFKGDLYAVKIVAGSHQQKRDALRSGADVFVTNFETALSMEPELKALLRERRGRSLLVVDESFFIKNLDTQRTRALRRLREWCGRGFVLCGTPAPNSPHDLIQQFNLVDFGVAFDQVKVPREKEPCAAIVQDTIERRGLFIRHLKAEVLPQLPVKQFNRILVQLEPRQDQLYRQALQNVIDDLRSTTDTLFKKHLTSFLARRSALLQICSNPSAVSTGYTETPAKLLALDSILEDVIVRRKEKVVLWSFYTASIEAIVSRFSRFNPVRYDGAVSDVAERRDAVRRFQDDDRTLLFVANPAAAGAGLTLHRARLAIYESMSNQAAHYLQSLDRIHRRGQEREVEYLILLCEDTVEIDEYDRLTRKERAAQELLGDSVTEPVTRQTLLAEFEKANALIRRQ